jgi:tRNA threonylcarbamoyladenosine biosynthesis protein TsaB
VTLLAVTTATPRFSAVILEDDAIVARVSHEDEMRHAERFFDQIDALLEAAKNTRRDLTAIACDIGPGSFTGVRVGLASCKGIAMTLGVPLVGVSSLEAMTAAAFSELDDRATSVVAVLDAKRGEVFYGGYDRAGAETSAGFARSGDAAGALAAALADPGTWFCGSASKGLVPEERRLEHAWSDRPDASWIARLGQRRVADALPVGAIEPRYLRGPDAKKPSAPPNLLLKA